MYRDSILDNFIEKFLSESEKKEKKQEKHISITEDEEKSLRREAEIESLKTDIDIKKEQLKGREQDRKQRKEFSIKIYRFLLIHMICVFCIVVSNSLSLFGFKMTEAVTITLLTTTTANVISVFVLVVKYLFNTKDHQS